MDRGSCSGLCGTAIAHTCTCRSQRGVQCPGPPQASHCFAPDRVSDHLRRCFHVSTQLVAHSAQPSALPRALDGSRCKELVQIANTRSTPAEGARCSSVDTTLSTGNILRVGQPAPEVSTEPRVRRCECSTHESESCSSSDDAAASSSTAAGWCGDLAPF
jgi:hypothetical protein